MKLAWIGPDTVKMHADDAMMLLDCVVQYGLNHADYHPRELLFEQLNLLTKSTGHVSNTRKAIFDIMLTDAMIAFENNVHYGKLNPHYTAGKIDKNKEITFSAVDRLIDALKNKEFMKTITLAQPQSKAYHALQYQMYKETGLYTNDCYEFSERGIRKMAINMERLRWYNPGSKSPITINIPSQILTFKLNDSVYRFKVRMSKVALHSLFLQSGSRSIEAILFMNGWATLRVTPITAQQNLSEKIPVKVFADGQNSNRNALTVRIVDGRKLVSILFNKANGNKVITGLNSRQLNNFKIAKLIPVNITYLTCEMNEGTLITYNDIFHADKVIEKIIHDHPLSSGL
jgi:murein L,D-transpeptidase YcbB/YkuD